MDKGLFHKVLNEQTLSADEALILDSALEDDAQVKLGKIVSSLDDHAPSLAWRSSLNQRLAKESRKGRWTPVFRFGFAAVAVAGASLLVATLTRTPQVEQPAGASSQFATDGSKHESLEDTLMNEHQEAAQQASLGIYVSFNDNSRG